jgi:hypothetical protein
MPRSWAERQQLDCQRLMMRSNFVGWSGISLGFIPPESCRPSSSRFGRRRDVHPAFGGDTLYDGGRRVRSFGTGKGTAEGKRDSKHGQAEGAGKFGVHGCCSVATRGERLPWHAARWATIIPLGTNASSETAHPAHLHREQGWLIKELLRRVEYDWKRKSPEEDARVVR